MRREGKRGMCAYQLQFLRRGRVIHQQQHHREQLRFPDICPPPLRRVRLHLEPVVQGGRRCLGNRCPRSWWTGGAAGRPGQREQALQVERGLPDGAGLVIIPGAAVVRQTKKISSNGGSRCSSSAEEGKGGGEVVSAAAVGQVVTCIIPGRVPLSREEVARHHTTPPTVMHQCSSSP